MRGESLAGRVWEAGAPVSMPDLAGDTSARGAAAVATAAGLDSQHLAGLLGHARRSFTDDVYTVVAEELAEQAGLSVPWTVSTTKD